MHPFRYLGEVAALGTAFFWTFSAMSFETAGKRVGSDAVNILRLAMALPLLSVAAWLGTGSPLPSDAAPRQWIWLGASGLVGYTMGDLFLFRAFLLVGSRVSMLVMASAPAITALLGLVVFGERISLPGLAGMALIGTGIAIVVMKRDGRNLRLGHPVGGILAAFGGALGQACGLILSKYGMAADGGGAYSVLHSSQIRVAAGLAGFALLYSATRKWKPVAAALGDGRGLLFTTAGAVCGPVIGVSLSLLAVTRAKAGVASPLMSVTPILILPFSALFLKERIRPRDALGAALAVAGVALMFLA